MAIGIFFSLAFVVLRSHLRGNEHQVHVAYVNAIDDAFQMMCANNLCFFTLFSCFSQSLQSDRERASHE